MKYLIYFESTTDMNRKKEVGAMSTANSGKNMEYDPTASGRLENWRWSSSPPGRRGVKLHCLAAGQRKANSNR
ncbi:MAG: hypothetical protein CM1200mP9_04330 [Gammaproteobacteria bacterium]|nr:MAG: hypothetical protein CM1200mP9_04330 [Gammaproteobacteria bacterium]